MLDCCTAFWFRPIKPWQIVANTDKAKPAPVGAPGVAGQCVRSSRRAQNLRRYQIRLADVPENALCRRRSEPLRDPEGGRKSHIGTGVRPDYQRYFYLFASNNLKLRRDSPVNGSAERMMSFDVFRLLRLGSCAFVSSMSRIHIANGR